MVPDPASDLKMVLGLEETGADDKCHSLYLVLVDIELDTNLYLFLAKFRKIGFVTFYVMVVSDPASDLTTLLGLEETGADDKWCSRGTPAPGLLLDLGLLRYVELSGLNLWGRTRGRRTAK